jgi:hypothetical protein
MSNEQIDYFSDGCSEVQVLYALARKLEMVNTNDRPLSGLPSDLAMTGMSANAASLIWNSVLSSDSQ